jgi:hypothetical protein
MYEHDDETNNPSGVNPYDLEQFDDDYSTTEVDESVGGEPLPDGKYQMSVEKVELLYSKNNNPMLVWQLRVLGPRYAGRKHWHRNMIVTKENIKWLKRDLLIAGLKIEKLSLLPQHLHELLDLVVEIQLKTKGEHQNSFLNKRITQAEVQDDIFGDDDVRF